MRILFIGGTGIISSACSELAVARGLDLYMLNRGKSELRPAPRGAKLIQADVSDTRAVENALGRLTFDAVVNFVVFTEEQVQRDIELFASRTAQYVFISSASAYQTPPTRLPVTESTPLHNPFWQYSRNKIACEEHLFRAHRERGFPATVVRPSHTYDRTLWPMHGGYSVVARMRREQPVVVHGDGTSLWTLTHHRDFAAGFVPLLGNEGAIGEAFHITSDEHLTWNQIHEIVARAAGTSARLVHVPSHVIATHDPEWGASLLGDKTHSMLFDNTKVKRLVPDFCARIPFSHGVRELVEFYDSRPELQLVDAALDRLMDTLIAAQARVHRQV